MSRKRKSGNSHLPTGLYRKKVRGKSRFRFIKIDGTEFFCPVGTLESNAIDMAIAYNTKHRNPLINVMNKLDPNNKPLSVWLYHIKNRVENEELKVGKICPRGFETFTLDIKRLSTLHGRVLSRSLSLEHVNEFLQVNVISKNKSNNVFNATLSFLRKVFKYLKDEGAVKHNFADDKMKKPKPQKDRIRLNKEGYSMMLKPKDTTLKPPSYLAIAMRLSLQTTHAVNEISLVKYTDCNWLPMPIEQSGLKVFGTLRIHRQKVKNKEASRVEIPITQELKTIIEDSQKDNIDSPFIVHRIKDPRGKPSKKLTHKTQCRPQDISEAFSDFRDKLDLYKSMSKEKRPSFHEIRSLSIYLYGKQGLDPQERAAHTDAKTTKQYTEGHVEWVQIQAAEIKI